MTVEIKNNKCCDNAIRLNWEPHLVLMGLIGTIESNNVVILSDVM
jgi:hypothetical protein